jgi:hypothetical protein
MQYLLRWIYEETLKKKIVLSLKIIAVDSHQPSAIKIFFSSHLTPHTSHLTPDL